MKLGASIGMLAGGQWEMVEPLISETIPGTQVFVCDLFPVSVRSQRNLIFGRVLFSAALILSRTKSKKAIVFRNFFSVPSGIECLERSSSNFSLGFSPTAHGVMPETKKTRGQLTALTRIVLASFKGTS